MRSSRVLLLCLVVANLAVSQEVLTMRSGNPAIRYLQGPVDGDWLTPFTPSSFASARSGPIATPITPNGSWLNPLPAAPLAQWVSANNGTALYAIPFMVTTPIIQAAQLEVIFACDNRIGFTVNGGFFVNGQGVGSTAGFSASMYAFQTSVTFDVTAQVTPGLNWVYLNAVDLGGPGGIVFQTKLTVTPTPPQPHADSYFWATTSQVFGAGSIYVLDRNGATVQTHLLPFGSVIRLAKTSSGTVWAADTAVGMLRPYDLVAGAGASVSASPLADFAVSGNGQIWTVGGGLFTGPVQVTRRDTNGALIETFTANLSATRGITVDPAGNAWIGGPTSPAAVEKFVPGVGSSGFITFGANGQVESLRADRTGGIWVFSKGTGITPELTRLNSAGVQTFNVAIPNAITFVMGPTGRVRVLVEGGGAARIDTLDATTGIALGSTPIPTGNYNGFTVDPLGNHWLTSMNGSVTLLDSWGLPVTSIPLGGPVGAADTGDATGSYLAGVLSAGIDSDGDGRATDYELSRGSDPLDETSVPATLDIFPLPISGTVASINMNASDFPGHLFITAAAMTTASIPVSASNGLVLPVNIDALFDLWTNPIFNVFLYVPNTPAPSIIGVLDANGQGSLDFVVPFGISGFSFTLAGGVVNPITGSIIAITDAIPVNIL